MHRVHGRRSEAHSTGYEHNINRFAQNLVSSRFISCWIISVDGYDFNLQTKFNLNEFVRTFSKWTNQFFKDIEACEMEWMVNELLRAHIKMPESR